MQGFWVLSWNLILIKIISYTFIDTNMDMDFFIICMQATANGFVFFFLLFCHRLILREVTVAYCCGLYGKPGGILIGLMLPVR